MRGTGLVLVVACAAGCFSAPERPVTPSVIRSLAPPPPAEGLIVDSILIEQSRGDTFIDRDLWANAAPVGHPEARVLLSENGLRAGLLGGTLPTKFQELLDSDTDTVSPQRLTFHTRKDAVLATAGPVPTGTFDAITDVAGQPRKFKLNQVRCGVMVRPEAAPDGRARVWCEPQVQHGDRRSWLRPNGDGTRFEKFEEVPLERFPALGFEVTLAADEYLIVGWAAEQPGTLGEVMFAVTAIDRPRQRLLVVRCHQAKPAALTDLPPITSPLKRPSVAAITAGRK